MLDRGQSLHLGWTPHLICVELVGAAELVAIFLRTDTAEQGVAGLEAQLLVVVVLRRVALNEEAVLEERHFF